MENKEILLRDYFKERKITFKQAAEMVDAYPTAIGNLVAGRVKFGAKVAKRWEDAFGIRARWLMYNEEPMMVNEDTTPSNIINVSRASGNGVAVAGHHPDVLVGGQQNSEFAEIIKKQQEQIDRLLSIIEKQITK